MSTPTEPKTPPHELQPGEERTEPDELTAEDLESVAGGIRVTGVTVPKLSGDSKDAS